MRKPATLEDQQNEIKKKYRRGNRAISTTRQTDFSDLELAVKKEAACHYKAADYSYTYIAEAVNTTTSIVKHWFEDDEMRVRTAAIMQDHVAGAVKLTRTYMIEAIETLMQMARTTLDENLAARILQDILDRGGVTKVNKSESATTNKSEVSVTGNEMLELLRNAPPEVQAQAAQQAADLASMVSEHAA